MPVCQVSVPHSFRSALSLLLAGLMFAGPSALAEGPVEIRAKDISLSEGGLLQGTVLNSTAQPVADVTVQILHGEKFVASTKSDSNGKFAVQGLRNGSHIIQVAGTQQQVRFWSENAAPPAALSQMSVVVSDDAVVRGQMGYVPMVQSGFYNTSTAAWLLIGTGVAVTLGTTLAADDYQQPASP